MSATKEVVRNKASLSEHLRVAVERNEITEDDARLLQMEMESKGEIDKNEPSGE